MTEGKKIIKGQPVSLQSRISQAVFHHHSPLPPVSAMMFYKPLVSFILAFAAASSVAAIATPKAQGGSQAGSQGGSQAGSQGGSQAGSQGNYSPPAPSPVSQCAAADTYCCNTWTNSQNPDLGSVGVSLNSNLIDGVGCSNVPIGGTW